MLQSSVLIFILLSSTLLMAGEREPQQTNFLQISRLEKLQKVSLQKRQIRDRIFEVIYPQYFLFPDSLDSRTWKSDIGFTVLKSEPFDKAEALKIHAIQGELKKYWGEQEYQKRMSSLQDQYDLIDIRYFSFYQDLEIQEACISVRWKAFLNGIMHACGPQSLSDGKVYFEIQKYGDEESGTLADQVINKKHARELLDVAIAALKIIYQDPDNRALLMQAIQAL